MDDRPSPDRTRREGVHAYPITLADGQSWGLALPSTRLRPVIEPGVDPLGRATETIRVVAEVGYPLEIRWLIDGLRDACARDEAESQYQALFRLAVALVRRAHDVGPAEAAELFESSLDDLPRLVEAVLSVVAGGGHEAPGLPRKENADA